ncbi:oxidation resistance protein 1 [Apodospora peruviana]|uniref:Oxidation resistance protein 1 n=1 Tax=Apodospora peruviana TaxID=516989 RepID=A0AAE0IBL0_9PEZI|nr:oxidation resistance protein 1 [Apodospora peruviana]
MTMSYHTPQNTYLSDESDPHSIPSSGAATPTRPSASATSSSNYLPSSVSSLWGGLIRRFSTEATPSHSASPSPTPDHGGQMPYNAGVDGVYVPPTKNVRRTASPMPPPQLEPLQLNGYTRDTAADARLLTTTIAEEIRIMVPMRLAIVDEWNLVYSLDQDGASLVTLYEKCAHYQGKRVGFVLVVKDLEGGIFGAYLSDYPRPAPKYFGNGECFLWRASVMASLPPPPSTDTTNLTARSTTIAAASLQHEQSSSLLVSPSGRASPLVPSSPSIRFKAFPYSGVNEYYMLCEAHFLSVGAGDGKYGLWLDDGLVKGISSTCQTFGNERLSDEGEKFGILGVEVWVIGAKGP